MIHGFISLDRSQKFNHAKRGLKLFFSEIAKCGVMKVESLAIMLPDYL